MKSFKNKVAVITGAASGIGQASAVAFAEAGADIACNDIADLSETTALIKSKGVRLYTEKTDMADRQAIKTFRDNVIKEFGQVDVLLNNAGIALGDRNFQELTIEDFDKITDINYWGVVFTTKIFYEDLLARPEAAIANVSSTAGLLGTPMLIPYCTTKFAVRGFTDALRAEHAVRNLEHVSVHTVHPGLVSTNITLNADYQGSNSGFFHDMLQKRGVSPQQAAADILNGIKNKTPRIMISDAWAQDLFVRLIPENTHTAMKLLMGMVDIDAR